jgi:SagB-type dehydrogenase family enzyme
MFDLSFREDIQLKQSPADGTLQLEGQQFNWTARKLSPGIRAALEMLAAGPTSEDALLEKVSQLDGTSGLIYLSQYLKRLSRLLCYTLKWEEEPIATLVPFVPPSAYQFDDNLVNRERAYCLSRFAYSRRDESGELILESLLGRAKIVLHGATAGAMVAALAKPQHPLKLASVVTALPEKAGVAFMNLLLNAQVIAPVGEGGRLAEEDDPTLAQWEFPDLMFHKHIRMGWKELPYGGTFRFRDRFEPVPMVKPNLPAEIVPLYKPDLDRLTQTDKPFTAVVEQRRTIRQYGEEPITVGQLGEFLYRVAAVRTLINMEGGWSYTRRPYPAGGALYELEIYPVVASCQGLAPGLYYYHPYEHQLHKVADKNPYVDALLYMAWTSADQQSQPQVLLNVTARFQVLQWKYESVAYALLTKHVGVLKQTMYLVATAMGLAPCALGGGNSDLFAQAAGLNYYAETSVGEFLLGSQKRGSADV